MTDESKKRWTVSDWLSVLYIVIAAFLIEVAHQEVAARYQPADAVETLAGFTVLPGDLLGDYAWDEAPQVVEHRAQRIRKTLAQACPTIRDSFGVDWKCAH